MIKKCNRKWGILLVLCIILVLLSVGCGNGHLDVSKRENTEDAEKKEESVHKETKIKEKIKEKAAGKDQNDFTYLEKQQMVDLNDPKIKCELYLPKGIEIDQGYAFYNKHGIYFNAYVNWTPDYESFEAYYDQMLEILTGPDRDYADFYCSEIVENGDDRYFIYNGKDIQSDSPFEIRVLEYMVVQAPGECVKWSLQMIMDGVDEQTELIIAELEKCYGIELSEFKTGMPLKANEINQDEYTAKENDKKLEEMEGYQYLGAVELADYDGKGACQVMIPREYYTKTGDSHTFSLLHGVWMTADVEEFYMGSDLMTELKTNFDSKYEYRAGNVETIRNIWKSIMIPVPGFEDAFYAIISYEKMSASTEVYVPKTEVLCYLQYDKKHYLALELFLSEEQYDDATETVIREIETAYGMDLSQYYPESRKEESAEDLPQKEEPLLTMSDLTGTGEVMEEETLPDTVLWFNATYAPITYSNGWDWKKIGGLKQTKENVRLEKMLLKQNWNVSDRESALETVEHLQENGHWNTCQEYMEELRELGLLDLDEREFGKRLSGYVEADQEDRYRIAYEMYQDGLTADDMAAWELCRVNHLYASFYLCGYMTYEEAMDASLENSLILQSMYDSWDEMIEGYLLGYRFWQRDVDLRESSPTQERRRICEMMFQMDDGPYALDWDMKLEKCW